MDYRTLPSIIPIWMMAEATAPLHRIVGMSHVHMLAFTNRSNTNRAMANAHGSSSTSRMRRADYDKRPCLCSSKNLSAINAASAGYGNSAA